MQPLTFVYIFGGIIIVFLILYFLRKLDPEIRAPIFNFFIQWWPIILAVIAYFYFRNKWGIVAESDIGEWKLATLALDVFILLYWGANMFLQKERYFSTQAISDNRSGSCADYKQIGEYIVLNIGTCNNLFPWPIGYETWVVPAEHFFKIDGTTTNPKAQIAITTFIMQADVDEVPPTCKEFIESNKNFNKTNIYYGEFTQSELTDEIDILNEKGMKVKITKRDFNLKIRDTQRLWNEQRTMTKGKSGDLKRYWSDQAAINRKMQGKSVLDSPPQSSGGESSE